ncbi:MAG: SLBB domain-containing protein, partial [Bacilli bacterium]|nr:SLBB domain-containing protein [Bacilli bacterium]
MIYLVNIIKEYRKHIFIAIFILSIVTVTYIYGKGGDETPIDEQKPPITIPTEKKEVKENPLSIVFDIKGAVVNPGAYKLDSDKRIYDAIRVSGGLTNDADTSLINLSKKLTDEMVIIIHTKDEVMDYLTKEPTIIYKDVECNCPEI